MVVRSYNLRYVQWHNGRRDAYSNARKEAPYYHCLHTLGCGAENLGILETIIYSKHIDNETPLMTKEQTKEMLQL